ncbi:unnamed protein product [Aureobasidium pullulans]|nr:unnamed protein product [Aureobasidium pullulans]
MVNDHITSAQVSAHGSVTQASHDSDNSAQVVIKTHGLEQGASMICSVRWFEALGCSARLRPNDRTSRHAFGDFSNVYMDQSCLRTARLWWTLQNSLPLYSERVDVCNHVGVQMQSRYVLSLFWRLENMQSLQTSIPAPRTPAPPTTTTMVARCLTNEEIEEDHGIEAAHKEEKAL